MGNMGHNTNRIFSFDRDVTRQVKGIAILLVILGHLQVYGLINGPDTLRFAGAWGVSIFLITSGFGLSQSYRWTSPDIIFFKKRIPKIIVPYAIVTISLIIVDFLVQGRQYSLSTVLLSILGLDLSHAVDPTMWYITFIFWWYLIFYMVYRLPISKPFQVILLFAASGLTYCIKSVHPLSAPYIFDFPVGVFLGIIRPLFVAVGRKIQTFIVIISTLSCLMLVAFP
jgi:fucose 4-O-acetylase-like acetyltransferase